MTLPNFLVLGAEKAGTTWLYAALNRHPDIFLPDTKEIHFFNERDSNLRIRDNFSRLGVSWYQKFFSSASTQHAVGEITPMYLCDKKAPQRISALLPDAKLIVSLREPGSRAYSHYKMALAKGHVTKSFDTLISQNDARILQRGLYSEQLKRYLALYPRENLKVILFDDIEQRPMAVLQELCTFLSVDTDPFPLDGFIPRENVSGAFVSPWLYNFGVRTARAMREMPLLSFFAKASKRLGVNGAVRRLNSRTEKAEPMSPAIRLQLAEYYARDIEALESLIDRPLAKWRASTSA